ncbi:MAG: hypothetical protein JXA90_16290, partial [Planctomycetes bacterium]|nr:hypothetical protein [Planctomycetota bacterium]
GARGVGLHVIKAIELTLPRQQVQHWRIGRDVPLGQEVLLHSDAGEGQGARLLVARVRRIP